MGCTVVPVEENKTRVLTSKKMKKKKLYGHTAKKICLKESMYKHNNQKNHVRI